MSSNLTLLAIFDNPSASHIARSYLEASDILCFVFDENISGLGWSCGTGRSGIRLMVHKDQYEEAKLLLNENPDIEDMTTDEKNS